MTRCVLDSRRHTWKRALSKAQCLRQERLSIQMLGRSTTGQGVHASSQRQAGRAREKVIGRMRRRRQLGRHDTQARIATRQRQDSDRPRRWR
eukprot:6175120-Pleurochrysis_carterae.AAC.4